MPKFRFEKTDYGFKAWAKRGNAYIYFGHFPTKKAAVDAYSEDY